MDLTVLGAGSFGTAMANHAASMGHKVLLWCRRSEQADYINEHRENILYLKGIILHKNIRATTDLHEAVSFSDKIILAVPAQSARSVMTALGEIIPDGCGLYLNNLAKGIETDTGFVMHRISAELLPLASYTALSGPSHASELARNMPTALVAASEYEQSALMWQNILNGSKLRVYTSNDVLGVEIGGAMKNVIAVAVGIARAKKFGDNSIAALATRGLAEIMRYGAFTGVNPLTLAGLAGIGDLMVTCYSMQSRNFRFGLAVGSGKSAEEAAKHIGQVVEGMHTVKALVLRARGDNIELPISEGVYKVLYENGNTEDILTELMFREPKPEIGV